jgi:integrase
MSAIGGKEMKAHLTDKMISALELAPDAESRYEVFDASIPNLAVRVGSKKKSFVLTARFGESKNSSRRALGLFPAMNTESARVAAHKWNEQIAVGIDPAVGVELVKEAEELRLRSTFASVMQDYVAYLPTRPRNLSVRAEINFIKRNLLDPARNPWLNKPISAVTDVDVEELIRPLNARVPAQAHTCYTILMTFFRWAMTPARRVKIGLKHNPIEYVTPRSLELARYERDRVFEYEETHAYLKASTAMPYPYGPCLRALMETGQRIGAVSGMRWSQLNIERKIWIIPGTKSKKAKPGKTSKVNTAQKVPLSQNFCSLLMSIRDSLPPDHGDFVFSFTRGETPIGNFSNLRRSTKRTSAESQPKGKTDKRSVLAKKPRNEAVVADGRFDRIMRGIVEEFGLEYEAWVWHDVRRTVRTHLEPITGRTEVAEAAIGHGQQGIRRVYNLHKYQAEIRRAFNAWSALLRKAEEQTCTIADWEHDPEAF